MKEKKRPNSKQPPWEPPAETDTSSFGRWLRREREMREISLREISEASKISLRYLEAFEDERFDLLPATVFAHGFLRQYARYVGLDGDDVVNRYLAARGQDPAVRSEDETKAKAALASRRRNGTSAWPLALLAGGVALLLAAVVFFLPIYMKRIDRPAPPPPVSVPPPQPTLAIPEPSPTVEEPGQPVPGTSPIQVTAEFLGECWIQSIVDGKNRTEEIRIQGETVEYNAEESVELKLGNAGAVSLSVNGKPFLLNATPGEVKSVRIDLAALGLTPPPPGAEAPTESAPAVPAGPPAAGGT